MTDNPQLMERIRSLTTPLQPQPTFIPPRLSPLADIKAVLFDVYGTLVISACGDIGLSTSHSNSAVIEDALNASGLPRPNGRPDAKRALHDAIRQRHRRAQIAGIDYPEIDIVETWSEVLSDLGLCVTRAQVRRFAIEYEFRTNAVWPMPGLANTLTKLSDRGLVLGIVSNAQFYTPLMLEAFLHEKLPSAGFVDCCSAWSYRLLRAKPSTAIYDKALSPLRSVYNILPSQILYVGNDIRNDIWPARRRGLRTALFAGDKRSLRLREDDPQMSGISPDRVITTLPQICDHLLAS